MRNLIGNKWMDASNEKVIKVENPATSDLIDTVPDSTLEDVEKEIAAYRQAQSKEPASKNKKSGNSSSVGSSKHSYVSDIYVPKDVLEELKKNA